MLLYERSMTPSSLVTTVRARLGLILVLIVLVFCAILLVRQRFFSISPEGTIQAGSTVTPEPPVVSSAELKAQWKQSVASILADYDQTTDARSARERLLALRVPAELKDAHLALFLAFNTLTDSRPEGAAKLTSARAQFASSTQP